MTHEEIDRLEGRDLDAAVYAALTGEPVHECDDWFCDGAGRALEVRHYSAGIAAAWLVVEAMQERGWWWRVQGADERHAWFGFPYPDEPRWIYSRVGQAFATTAPLAITRACLKALAACGESASAGQCEH